MAKIFKSTEPGGRADYGFYLGKALLGFGAAAAVNLLLAVLLPLKGRWKWLRTVFIQSALNNLQLAFRLLYFNKAGRFKHRNRLLKFSKLRGEERALDLGSGNGPLAIGLAKAGPGLKITAVDQWKKGGSEETLRSNIDLEEAGGRIHVYQADPRRLPFAEASFDLVISDLYLSRVGRKENPGGAPRREWRKEQRAMTLAEIDRVLAPGGRVVISDWRAFPEYSNKFKEMGYTVETFGPYRDTFPPLRVVVAAKPA